MRLSILSAFALAVETAYGYVDTSPFFMFSTSEILLPSGKLQTAASISSDISRALSQCPSDLYILVSQTGVTPRDYSSPKNTPFLSSHLSTSKPHQQIRSSTSIPEVVSDIDILNLQRTLIKHCDVRLVEYDIYSGSIPITQLDGSPRLLTVHLPPPPLSSQKDREDDLRQKDGFLASVLDVIPSTNYTVIYTTSAKATTSATLRTGEDGSDYIVEQEVGEMLHTEIKRDLSANARKTGNQTIIDGPLFEKYQFFTPGIFMGFLVGLLLLSIMYVGISALASLSVTYAAFDKDQGQLAAKKPQ